MLARTFRDIPETKVELRYIIGFHKDGELIGTIADQESIVVDNITQGTGDLFESTVAREECRPLD